MYQSSNPALNRDDTFRQFYGAMAGMKEKSDVATLAGVVNKTTILVLIAVVAGAMAYAFIPATGGVLILSALAAFGVCIGVGIMMCGNPKRAPIMAPIYAVVEGIFLGVMTAALDSWLAQLQSTRAIAEGARPGGGTVSLAMPAFLITISVMLAMLGLYAARIIQPTERFQAVMRTLVVGVMITYLLSFVLSFVGVQIPFLSLSSATGSGAAPYIGLGISLLILGIASFCLIVDFGRVEQIVNSGAPRYMEWYAGFGLLVTLAWIYFEAVKLAFRLYLLFGRD